MFAERHTIKLQRSPLGTPLIETKISAPVAIAQTWVAGFEAALRSGSVSDIANLLHGDCWWRDMLALSWDIRTVHRLDKVSAYLADHLPTSTLYNLKLRESGKFSPAFVTPIGGLEWIESMFEFETKIGVGSGMLRLVQGADGIWKGQMIYTALQELKGFEDKAGARRPHGGNESLTVNEATRGNWLDRRRRQVEFLDEEPTVLVIGAGQSGLNMGARLQAMGMSCLLVDKNERVGDNWRNRYKVSSASNCHHCPINSLSRLSLPTTLFSIHTWLTSRFPLIGPYLPPRTNSETGLRRTLL